MNEVDKAREEFLEHVHVMIDYWMNLDSEGTPQGETELKWKMEGLAFSMLVALDGGAGGLPKAQADDVLWDHVYMSGILL